MQKYKELFEERAAIMEFDGGLSKDEAELLAKDEILKLYEKEGGTNREGLLFQLRGLMFKTIKG